MKTSQQTHGSWTTVILEIEHDCARIDCVLAELAAWATILSNDPLTIINRYDEDIRVGHSIVFATNKPECISGVLDDIAEIVRGY
jgi:hypothetical protein